MRLAPFVDASWLAEHVDDAQVRVVDCRWSLEGTDGFDTYVTGHVPGAAFVDLDRELSGSPGGTMGRHPLPTPEGFASAMSRAGIGDATTVVAVDTAGGATAARLVWMLRVLGRPAAVLDGGLAAWPGELEAGEVTPPPAHFTVRPWPAEAVADADDVERVVASGGLVVDARAPERYRGDVEPVDPRPGHVPGAISLPFADNVTARGRLRPDVELSARFAEAGAAPDRETIVYCGSGVTACHDVLAMEQVGLPRPRLFVGSWSAWSADPDRPAATGPHPG